ncbi:amino acid ABC transporter substrate-binding protein, PAAT family [Sanguibacter gelidistatuariae]|uniref:Amino acid ABC transporter substrate-binding protein, PAAT family n=1 Tax=Sanguibacter gelidistatuariae TaxID=1814289 RepID=A0A1G6Y3J9_9MICO|nr:ABC transporter substrate-binding protein [Sanguibacter gelidistatuariae]SDD84205.1 amino acid ABC transporter substrate-binding protein, PAAT family [Sanguibacter gelidistatuariae]
MRRFPFVAAAATLTLLLAGCGSGDSPSSGTSSAGAVSFDPTSIAKDATIAALVPESVASTGKLVVGSDTTYAPAEYIGTDGQTPEGYDVDLAKAIGAVLGLKTEVQTASFTGIIPAIGSKYDIGMSSFTITPEREGQVNMVQYFSAGEAYAVAKGNPKKVNGADLCGLTVGVETGTVEDEELDALVAKCAADGKDAITPLKYDKQSDVTTALVGGKADIMYADSPIIAYAVEQTGGQIEQLGDVFSGASQGIVVSKDDQALTEAVQQAVQKLIDSGDYLKILTAWGNEVGAVKTAELNPSVS